MTELGTKNELNCKIFVGFIFRITEYSDKTCLISELKGAANM